MNQSSSVLGEFTQMRTYLMARLMWDPNCDFAAEMADFLQAYYGPGDEPIGQYIEMMRQKVAAGLVPLKPLPTDVLCPSSGKPMFVRDGEFYPFLACENHPNCKGELEVDGASAEVVLPRRPPMKTDLACPDCDRPLELRRSHFYGPWTLCPSYPDCLGRLGWSTIQPSQRMELKAALIAHENPIRSSKFVPGMARSMKRTVNRFVCLADRRVASHGFVSTCLIRWNLPICPKRSFVGLENCSIRRKRLWPITRCYSNTYARSVWELRLFEFQDPQSFCLTGRPMIRPSSHLRGSPVSGISRTSGKVVRSIASSSNGGTEPSG